MTILLRKLLPVAATVILGLLVVVPSPGQVPVKPGVSGDQNITIDGEYPRMPESLSSFARWGAF